MLAKSFSCCLLLALIPMAVSADGPHLRWYASRTSVVVSGLTDNESTLRVRKPGGETVYEQKVQGPRSIAAVCNGKLSDGSYRAELIRGGTVVTARDFVHTNYPWFNTSVGRADILLPGFSALKTSGRVVECVGRKYVFADNGFPAEIWSCGQQILARPIELKFSSPRTDGRSDFAITNATSTRVGFRGGCVRGRVEQDGFILLDISLPETEGKVSLEISVKREYAEFYHVCGDAIRSNPAGRLPTGRGRVFGSRSMGGCGMTLKNFMPYCWIGTDTRGICYAADVDRGWVHGSEGDAMEIFRESDGTVTMRLNLIAAKGRHGPRNIELALQSSPVKPMPKGWRGWVDAYDVAGTRNMLCQASSPTWGCYINGMARYPTFEDWSFVDKMCEAAKTGRYDHDYLERWIVRCLDARRNSPLLIPWLAAKKDEAQAEATLRAHARAALVRPLYLADKSCATLYYYTCDRDPSGTLYEMPVMRDEWGDRVSVYGSHQDYAEYYLKKMCEHGMRGVYNDNAFPRANRDWVDGGAWFDERGELHPSYGLWALREHARRQIVTMLECGISDPWLTIHHTNANILPIVSFATNLMGMEDKYGKGDFQDRWPRDYIRTVNQGYQAGVFATSIEGPFQVKDKSEKTRLTRTMLATLLPHEVQPTLSKACDHELVRRILQLRQDFGIGADDCVYTAYYDPSNPLVQPNPDVMISVYRRGDHLLLIIGSCATRTLEVPLRSKKSALRDAVDLETDSPLPLKNGIPVLTLPAHGFAIISAFCPT